MKVPSVLAALSLATVAAAAGSSVKGSKHDLSVSGPGPIRAVSETQSCVFCHVSHGGTGPGKLSARPDVADTHRSYQSTTLRGRAGVPTGTTRVCLSCHDGTIAVGQTRRGTIAVTGAGAGGRIPETRRSNLGTDLRGTHPVSMPVAPGRRIHAPPDARVSLDARGEVQCTSCHDPHSEFGGSPEGFFLVRPTARAELCVTCHEIGRAGVHASSPRPFTAAQGNEGGYASVADAGCRACHRSHAADPGGRLLSRGRDEADDALCLRCHGGASGGSADVARQLSKPSSHAAALGRRVHDASEGPDVADHRLPEQSASAPRHVACVDCHEPHEATRSPAAAPIAPGALRGVWGIDASGREADPARLEYEVCFKCHGDSANIPARTGLGVPRRGSDERNLRRAFDPGALSYHPVVAPVANGDVPSLTAGFRPGSQVYCTDCHASDDGAGAGGKGASGPHGSVYAPLLERNYDTVFAAESPFTYALCYKCHDRGVLLSSRSAFPLHRVHVVDRQVPCSTCHVAHGVPAASGSRNEHAHLVDFDLGVVRPGPGGALRYDSRGRRAGSCTLACHGATHDGAVY